MTWIDQRSREVFPENRDEFFGGLSVILIGDFFQLPPVLNKPLYSARDDLKDIELVGRNVYLSFDKSVLLTTVQRQQGKDQAPFRRALEELRKADVTVASWQLLTSRCSVKLSPEEVDSFGGALRIYPTKAQVVKYNHDHMLGPSSAAVLVEAIHEGVGAEKVESSTAGNLVKQLPLCVGCRVMLTRNLWTNVGLVDGARGTVHDISWKAGTDVLRDPPKVIMVVFDDYDGPAFTMPSGEPLRREGKMVVPILRVRQEFMVGTNSCSRAQFPLLVSCAITVHKSQGITLDKVVCDISAPEFAAGLSYVAVSRVKALSGLMFENPFDRDRVYREKPSSAMKLKLADHVVRLLQELEEVEDDELSEESDWDVSSGGDDSGDESSLAE
jgi:ATP-dependent exoDNAse (exonuclease V) alpha subunit